MTGRELVLRTLRQEEVERLPRFLWTIPYIPLFRKDELDRFLTMFPLDITFDSGVNYGKSRYSKGEQGYKGEYTDGFGCTREMLEDGVAGEVKNPIIKTAADLDNYLLPWELLDEAVCEGQLERYKQTKEFVIGGSQVSPFERMQFMRGTEQLFLDIATEDPIFFRLRDMLHEFFLRDLRFMGAQALDAVLMVDDWGAQNALLISPQTWRKLFKPMYKEYCDIIHKAGKYVFFHCDGHIEAILGDLAEIGVDAINMTPPEVLNYIFLRVNPERHIDYDSGLGVMDICDEYDRMEALYFSREFTEAEENSVRAYEIAQHNNIPKVKPVDVSFRHLVNVVQMADGTDGVIDILKRTGKFTNPSAEDVKRLERRIDCARFWLSKFAPDNVKFSISKDMPNVVLSDDERKYLGSVADKLDKTEWNAESIHNVISDEAKTYPFGMKGGFQALYKVLIGRTSGPRLGHFLEAMDKKFVVNRLKGR